MSAAIEDPPSASDSDEAAECIRWADRFTRKAREQAEDGLPLNAQDTARKAIRELSAFIRAIDKVTK